MDDQDLAIDAILGLLDAGAHIAVVGLSDKPGRPSNEVAAYLVQQGFSIHPVNPLLDSVFDIPCHPDLQSIAEPVAVVDVFRRSLEAGSVVDDAIAIGARAVWLQEGVIDEDAARRASDAGLLVVMDRCLLKEHARRSS